MQFEEVLQFEDALEIQAHASTKNTIPQKVHFLRNL